MNETFQYITSVMGTMFQCIGCLINIFVTIGVIFAYKQVLAAQRSLRFQTLQRIIDDWRSPEIYKSMRYIDHLRGEWKKRPTTEWNNLANNWVLEHSVKSLNTSKIDEQKLSDEWILRRNASQFLSKVGLLIEKGYIDEDDFFGIDPEVGRQLVVLIPIEIAIHNYWLKKELEPIAIWDRPVPKWEFDRLWERYNQWYLFKGKHLKVSPINFNNT